MLYKSLVKVDARCRTEWEARMPNEEMCSLCEFGIRMWLLYSSRV